MGLEECIGIAVMDGSQLGFKDPRYLKFRKADESDGREWTRAVGP